MKKDEAGKGSVGIITYHKAFSMGATAQCYALQKALRNEGYRAEIIDYSMEGFRELRKNKRWYYVMRTLLRIASRPKMMLWAVYHNYIRDKKQKKLKKEIDTRNLQFKKFWDTEYYTNGINYSTYSKLKKHPPNYDAYICGSDQIWNPGFCDMDDNYYLAFAPEEKRIAYAPSLGTTDLEPQVKTIIQERLAHIPYTSFREDSMCKVIGRDDIPVVIDPTFLLSKKSWCEVAKKSSLSLPDKYALTYFIGNDRYIQGYKKKLEEICGNNIELINLMFDYCPYGPYDFVRLIRDAKFIVTNSFHGCALSLNMNVPFCVGKSKKDMISKSGFTRIESLLSLTGLESRLLDEKGGNLKSIMKTDINFQDVNERLGKAVEFSRGFLFTSLESVIRQ